MFVGYRAALRARYRVQGSITLLTTTIPNHNPPYAIPSHQALNPKRCAVAVMGSMMEVVKNGFHFE